MRVENKNTLPWLRFERRPTDCSLDAVYDRVHEEKAPLGCDVTKAETEIPSNKIAYRSSFHIRISSSNASEIHFLTDRKTKEILDLRERRVIRGEKHGRMVDEYTGLGSKLRFSYSNRTYFSQLRLCEVDYAEDFFD